MSIATIYHKITLKKITSARLQTMHRNLIKQITLKFLFHSIFHLQLYKYYMI